MLNIGGTMIPMEGFEGEEDNFFDKDFTYQQTEEQLNYIGDNQLKLYEYSSLF